MCFFFWCLVMLNDFNYVNFLFGGCVLEWIDEEVVIWVICQLEINCLVIKYIGEISFELLVMQGDIVEFGLEIKVVGCMFIIVSCLVCNKVIKKIICFVDDIVFVKVDFDMC